MSDSSPAAAEVVGQLQALAARIEGWERAVLEAANTLADTKCALADYEAMHLHRDAVEGRNAEQRAAHLRHLTAPQREALEDAERAYRQATAERAIVQGEAQIWRAIAALLAGRG